MRVASARGGSRCFRWGVKGTLILGERVLGAVLCFRRFRGGLRLGVLFLGCKRWVFVLEVVEFALSNLLPNDVHVSGHVYFLIRLRGEAWEQAYDYRQKCLGPEGKCSIHLLGCLVELETVLERRVDASPGKNQKDADHGDECHEPIPPVGIEEDVNVDDNNGCVCNKHTHLPVVVDGVPSIGVEGGRCEQEIRHEEDYQRLVKPIKHVQPTLC